MRNKDGTFQEDIQCILEPTQGRGAIFISNIEAASNLSTLQKHRIGAVITAARGKNLVQTMPKHIQYLYIPAVDHQSFDISQYFEASYALLSEELPRTNVLVHCMAGVSRSATLVIAFLMRSRSLSFDEAFRFVKQKRKIICPNSSFLEQLKEYERTLTKPKEPSSKPIGKLVLENESTSSSWYSPKKCPVKPVANISNQADYDMKLRQRIQALFAQKVST